MAKKMNDTPPSFPISNHVDGNNTKTFHEGTKPLQVEKGHTFWTDSETGKRTEKPEWSRD